MQNIFRTFFSGSIHRFTLPVCALSVLLLNATPMLAFANSTDTQKKLEASINGSWRSEKNRARDQYRHPLETLLFFGIKPNSTVIELFPSSGAWYTEILAPFLHDHGRYIAASATGNTEDAGQKEKFAADARHFGKVHAQEFSAKSMAFGPANSADLFLTFRNVHNLAMDGQQENLFKAIFKVLKSGGVLGIVDHRAADGKSLADVIKTGYLPEVFVIAEAEKVGFKLDATSTINNNVKDTKDYAKGVWSLPPTFAEGEINHTKYAAIGESDRFTLRFIKP